jgi:hypothetical protein
VAAPDHHQHALPLSAALPRLLRSACLDHFTSHRRPLLGADKGTQFGDLLLQLVGALDDQPYDSRPLRVDAILLVRIAFVVLKFREIRNETLGNVELVLQILLVDLPDAAVAVERKQNCAATLRDMERATADRIKPRGALRGAGIRFIECTRIVAASDQLVPAGELLLSEGTLRGHVTAPSSVSIRWSSPISG